MYNFAHAVCYDISEVVYELARLQAERTQQQIEWTYT